MKSNKYEPRVCIICGKEYIPRRSDQRTCGSPRCKHERHKRQCIKWRDNNRDAVRESNRKHMRRKREEPVPRKDTLIAIGYAERQREQTLKMVGRVKVEL